MVSMLSSQFDDHLKSFRPHAEAEGWDTCEGAGGKCDIATESFISSHGGSMVQYAGARFPLERAHPHWRENYSKYPGALSHRAAEVGDKVVDWTFRQFDPDADFPLVEDREVYAKRWDRRYGD